jgi:hypothetical protein
MQTTRNQNSRLKTYWDNFFLGFLLVFVTSIGMLIWWFGCVLIVHPLFHAPVLAGTVSWEYGETRSRIGVHHELVLLVSLGILPQLLVAMIVAGSTRVPWWGWLSAAIVLGGLFGILTYFSNPNYMGIEYSSCVQGAWLWACGMGFFFRRLARWLRIR